MAADGDDVCVDVIVIGAGLSGLVAAWQFLRDSPGSTVAVVEARGRAGGRTLNLGGFDVGGAWCWPHANPHLVRLAAALAVPSFPQPGDREPALADVDDRGRGEGRRVRSGPQQWVRFDGGAAALADRLAAALPDGAVRLGWAAAAVGPDPDGDGVAVRAADGRVVRARVAVVAVPPRVAAARIEFDPPLPPARKARMLDFPTWMGGAAKVVATYASAFWRDAGLSGSVFSQTGPLVQVYDASGRGGGSAALCGFVFGDDALALADGGAGGPGPAAARVRDRAAAQLERIFGRRPLSVESHSWRGDEWTTPDSADPGPAWHPRGDPELSVPHAGGRVLWAGAESSVPSCGLLDGAVAAGVRAAGEAAAACAAKK